MRTELIYGSALKGWPLVTGKEDGISSNLRRSGIGNKFSPSKRRLIICWRLLGGLPKAPVKPRSFNSRDFGCDVVFEAPQTQNPLKGFSHISAASVPNPFG